MSTVVSSMGLGVAPPRALSHYDVGREQYQVSDPEPRELSPYELLAVAVVRQAILDTQRRDARAQRWLVEGFPTSVWAQVLPACTAQRLRTLCKS